MRKLHRWSKRSIKHKLLSNLKADGGTFDSVEDIEKYMRTPKSEKKKRLKMEVQYCRDTSARLLHNNKLLNIMKPKGQGKKEMLSTSEFSKNLRLYFGKVSDQQDQQVDTVDLFRKALKSVKK